MEAAARDILEKQANAAVSKAILRFANAQSNARRFHREAIGKDVDPERCFGDFLRLVADDNGPLLEKRYGAYRTKTALSVSGGGPTGGYLVPAELRDDLMGDVAEEAIIRPRATVVPTSEMVLELPYWDVATATANGIAPFWGGMQMQFTEEQQTLPESEPNFRQLAIQVHELGGTILASAPLMQDAKGLEAWLLRAFGRSLAWYEDWAFTNGSGSGQPQGFIGASCGVKVTRQGSEQYSAADGQNMFAKLFSPLASNAVWLFSITAAGSLVAQTNWWVNGPMELYGQKVFRTLHQPPLGTAGDVIVADPSLYVVADRQALEISASPYTDGTVFKRNQWMWRVVERVGGEPLLPSPITVPDGASSPHQVSPIVVLN